MKNSITAQQAHSIASGEYENLMSIRVGEFLEKVYKRIRTASEAGRFEASVDIDIQGNKYRDRITEVLELDGYNVSYGYLDYHSHDYVKVSWRTPT